MIALTRRRDVKSVPTDFRGPKLIDKHVDLVERFYAARQAGKPIKFSSSKWRSAKAKLSADTDGKCAYCEASTSVVAHGDVEHFRPKSKYWWLAYTFDNYLFSCQLCNQVYKGDNFPISHEGALEPPVMPATKPDTQDGIRLLAETLIVDATISDDAACVARWSAESAHLIHPYLEDPERSFIYKADVINGEVWIQPRRSERAQEAYAASTAHLGLNREELRKTRYRSYATLAVLRSSYMSDQLADKTRGDILAHFDFMRSSDHPFSAMHRHFLREWGF